MGTLRYYTDHLGDDRELSEHEGYIESELDIENPLTPQRGRWAAHDGPDTRGHFTGRHRPACSCGWRGSIFEPDAPNRWRGRVNFHKSAMMFPDDLRDALMDEWSDHADNVIATKTTLAGITYWREQRDRASAQLDAAVLAARDRYTWDEIARALGITRQAAHQRWAAAAAPPAK